MHIVVDIVTGITKGTKMLHLGWMKNMTQCRLIRRDDFFDVFLDGKKCGSGSWSLVYTAVQFYRLEGFDVKVIE